MIAQWQEISTLKSRIATLKNKIARQSILKANLPILRPVDVVDVDDSGDERTYQARERTVAAQKTQEFVGVKSISGNAIATAIMSIDSNAERYFLPFGGLILVEDQGDNTAKEIVVDADGVATVPTGAAAYNMVVAEPDTQFHDNEYPFASGRIYLAQKLIGSDGITPFFIVFLAGFGPLQKTLGTTVEFDIDSSGKILEVRSGIVARVDTRFQIDVPGIAGFYPQTDTSPSDDIHGLGYYCFADLESHRSNYTLTPLMAHYPGNIEITGTTRKIHWYDSYDYATDVFSDFRWTMPATMTTPMDNGSYFWRLRFMIAGTGIPNKTSYFPGRDIYTAPGYAGQPYIYPECEETRQALNSTAFYNFGQSNYITANIAAGAMDFFTAGVMTGDEMTMQDPSWPDDRTVTITYIAYAFNTAYFAADATYPITVNTTLTVPALARTSIYQDDAFTEANGLPRWIEWQLWLTTGIESTYDPITDTNGSGNYVAWRGRNAHEGFNEDSEDGVVYLSGGFSGQTVPGYPGATYAHYYCTVPPIFVSGYDSTGGKVYVTRDKTLWRHWNGSAWVVPPGPVNFGSAIISAVYHECWTGSAKGWRHQKNTMNKNFTIY